MEVNELQKSVLVEKIVAKYGADLTGKTFGMWGLAFKPNTDDIREAPALVIIERLTEMGAKVVAYDPEAMEAVQKFTNLELEYADNMYGAIQGADALIIVTEWNEFRSPDFERVKLGLKENIIFDGRNVYDLETMESQKFTYHSIGRKSIYAPETVSSE